MIEWVSERKKEKIEIVTEWLSKTGKRSEWVSERKKKQKERVTEWLNKRGKRSECEWEMVSEREREVEKKGKWRKKNKRLLDPLRFLFEFILPMPTSYYRKGNIFNGVPISMHLFYSIKICVTW